MAGDQELLRLAQLLRLCGDLASAIAGTRDGDGPQIRVLSSQTVEIARNLEELVARSSAADALDRSH